MQKLTYWLVTGGSNPFAHLQLNQAQLPVVMALDPGMPPATKHCAVRYAQTTATLGSVLVQYVGKVSGYELIQSSFSPWSFLK